MMDKERVVTDLFLVFLSYDLTSCSVYFMKGDKKGSSDISSDATIM